MKTYTLFQCRNHCSCMVKEKFKYGSIPYAAVDRTHYRNDDLRIMEYSSMRRDDIPGWELE